MLLLPVTAAGQIRGYGNWDGQVEDNTSHFIPRLLALHNAERARLGAEPLSWNPALARDASGWATNLAARGLLQHSSQDSRPGQGENLFLGTAGAYSLEEMIGAFLSERSDFRPGVFPEVSRSGRWQMVAHYTQIIWRGTSEMGCAMASARGRDILVCRYSPPGNVMGQRVP